MCRAGIDGQPLAVGQAQHGCMVKTGQLAVTPGDNYATAGAGHWW